MGIDAVVYFKANKKQLKFIMNKIKSCYFLCDYSVCLEEDEFDLGVKPRKIKDLYYIYLDRWWSEDYPRGPAARYIILLGILLYNVRRVWIFEDHYNFEDVYNKPFTLSDYNKYCESYYKSRS